MYFIKTREDFRQPEYLDEIISKRYKDTPFAIIKEKIGKMWTVYIILDKEHVVGCMTCWTKGEAIKEIEAGEIQKSIDKELKTLTVIHDFFINNEELY
jgi:hypothetical protein